MKPTDRSAPSQQRVAQPSGAGPAAPAPAETPADWGQDAYRAVRAGVQQAVAASGGGGLFETWKRFAEALVTGERTLVPGTLPPFPTLDPAALSRAKQAGRGRSVPQPLLAPAPGSQSFHDPVNLIIRGSREDLVEALKSQGWAMAAPRTPWNFVKMGLSVLFHLGRDVGAPVSEQFLDGRGEDMAFNKNSDYNRGRDHLRVFHRGRDPETGEDVWAVAAVRDGALTVNIPHPETHGKTWPWQWDWCAPRFSHDADEEIDGERDLVMQDLLASGQVRDWAAVDGVLPPGQSKRPMGDGTYKLIDRYPTDGLVYEVSLG